MRASLQTRQLGSKLSVLAQESKRYLTCSESSSSVRSKVLESFLTNGVSEEHPMQPSRNKPVRYSRVSDKKLVMGNVPS